MPQNRLLFASTGRGPMKRVVVALVVAVGIAVVAGSGVWAVKTLAKKPNATASEVVVNPQMAAIPKGGISTGDGSMAGSRDRTALIPGF
jgi:formylglycine-generating enzyme required for sulfatase activity